MRTFLDAGYTLLVEEYQRLGTDLMTAIERTAEWSSGGARSTQQESVTDVSPTDEVAMARANDQAMAELQKMLAGT